MMAIPYEHRDSIKKYLLRETKMSEEEVERLIDRANKIDKKCRYCSKEPAEVYDVHGISLFERIMQSEKKLYLCLHCGSTWL